MSEVKETSAAVVEPPKGDGRIIFAEDVVATIAALAAADVEGVAAMNGGVMDGFTEMLGGRKSVTKGVKVEVGTEEAAADLSVNIQYGYRIREVCEKIQQAVKTAIETMTGLRVVEVNVFVQSVVFESEPSRADKKKEEKALEKAQKEQEAAEKLRQKELEKAEKEQAEKEKAEAAIRVK